MTTHDPGQVICLPVIFSLLLSQRLFKILFEHFLVTTFLSGLRYLLAVLSEETKIISKLGNFSHSSLSNLSSGKEDVSHSS